MQSNVDKAKEQSNANKVKKQGNADRVSSANDREMREQISSLSKRDEERASAFEDECAGPWITIVDRHAPRTDKFCIEQSVHSVKNSVLWSYSDCCTRRGGEISLPKYSGLQHINSICAAA